MMPRIVSRWLDHLSPVRERGRRSRPYPVSVTRRDPHNETPPPGNGIECFDTPLALGINKARLEHLDSLGLPLEGKSVLDVGCGIGHLAQFFVRKNCNVVCVDGREENIAHLRVRYPHLQAHVGDVETFPLASLGSYDVVFCYGLLYHLEDPVAGLRNIAGACKDLLLLETCICDSSQPVLHLIDEPPSTVNQTLRALGCRVSPAYVTMALNRVGFPHVYAPLSRPNHPDFQFRWLDNLDHWRDGHLLRCIFVASRKPLENPRLSSLL